MLTLSGSLGGATCQEITAPHLRKGVSQAPGGGVPRRPSFSPHHGPQPQLSRRLRARQLRQLFRVSLPSPTGGKPGKGPQPGILGAAVEELGGSARLCIREPAMRPPQGRPEMGPRSQGELAASLTAERILPELQVLEWRLQVARPNGPAEETDSSVGHRWLLTRKGRGRPGPRFLPPSPHSFALNERVTLIPGGEK